MSKNPSQEHGNLNSGEPDALSRAGHATLSSLQEAGAQAETQQKPLSALTIRFPGQTT